jgi:hypothetical protein
MQPALNQIFRAAGLVVAALTAGTSSAETVKHGSCAERDLEQQGERSDDLASRSVAGTMSTRVEAGNGRVSSETSLAPSKDHGRTGGSETEEQGRRSSRSVTVTSSNNGSVSSSSSSSSTNGTAAASGSGDCVIISD